MCSTNISMIGYNVQRCKNTLQIETFDALQSTLYLQSFVFNWFALSAMCLMPLYLSLFFLQCPHLYICIVCMYVCLNCIYLYLYVYCQCLMLTVCTKGLRVTQFQFSVCMCCTCGRIDNKADLTWLDMTWNTKCLPKTVLIKSMHKTLTV